MITFGIEGRRGGRFHTDKFMPGVIVIVQCIEETFIDVNLSGDEIFAVIQAGANLLFNLLQWELFFIGLDRLAMLFVIGGIAVHIGKANVRHGMPGLPLL